MEKKLEFYANLATSIFRFIPNITPSQSSSIGLSTQLSTLISKLTMQELDYVSLKASHFLSIEIDKLKLERIIAEANSNLQHRDIEDQFIHAYATNIMMKELFGMHTVEFCARRKLLGLAGEGRHRPQYCDIDTEELIWEQWDKTAGLEHKQRYLSVAERTGQPLNVIWPALQRRSS